MRRAWILAVAAVLVLAGCGGGGDDPGKTGQTVSHQTASD